MSPSHNVALPEHKYEPSSHAQTAVGAKMDGHIQQHMVQLTLELLHNSGEISACNIHSH